MWGEGERKILQSMLRKAVLDLNILIPRQWCTKCCFVGSCREIWGSNTQSRICQGPTKNIFCTQPRGKISWFDYTSIDYSTKLMKCWVESCLLKWLLDIRSLNFGNCEKQIKHNFAELVLLLTPWVWWSSQILISFDDNKLSGSLDYCATFHFKYKCSHDLDNCAVRMLAVQF